MSAVHQLRKLSQSPDATARATHEQIFLQEYRELGATEVQSEPKRKGYYLPHHAVIKDGPSSTKLRVVFNTWATQQIFKSLDVLDPGPSLLPSITGILCRFRRFPIALHADIRKTFFFNCSS